MSKVAITGSFTFTPGSAGNGTLDLSSIPGGFNLSLLYAVIDSTKGLPLFVAGSQQYSLVSDVGGLLKFSVSTSSCSSGDSLLILYDTASTAVSGISDTTWIDPTTLPLTYYVRTDAVINGARTISWTNPAGAPQTPIAANLIPPGSATTPAYFSQQFAIVMAVALGG